jgi:hypothetical protein
MPMLVGKALLTRLIVGCWVNFWAPRGTDTHLLEFIH